MNKCKDKSCPPDKICNPLTGRCVLKTGRIGKKLAIQKSKSSHKPIKKSKSRRRSIKKSKSRSRKSVEKSRKKRELKIKKKSRSISNMLKVKKLLGACIIYRFQGNIAGVDRDIYLVGERHSKMQKVHNNSSEMNYVNFYHNLFQDINLPKSKKIDFYLEDMYGAYLEKGILRGDSTFENIQDFWCKEDNAIINCLRAHFTYSNSKYSNYIMSDKVRYHYNDARLALFNPIAKLCNKFLNTPSSLWSWKYFDDVPTVKKSLQDVIFSFMISNSKEYRRAKLSDFFDNVFEKFNNIRYIYGDGTKHMYFKKKYKYLPEIAKIIKEKLVNENIHLVFSKFNLLPSLPSQYVTFANNRHLLLFREIAGSMIDIYTFSRILHHPEQQRIIYHAGRFHTGNAFRILQKLGMKLVEQATKTKCPSSVEVDIQNLTYPWFQ